MYYETLVLYSNAKNDLKSNKGTTLEVCFMKHFMFIVFTILKKQLCDEKLLMLLYRICGAL